MLRIAVPNKGSLSEPAVELLKEAGYRQRRDGRELVLQDPENDVELLFLRPRDIAVYVGSGQINAGITGRDLLLDSAARAVEHLPLNFARSTFRFAGPAGQFQDLSQIAGKRVATSYDVLVQTYMSARGIDAEVIHLDGAVESAVHLGVADLIADVVETGSTLRAAGLEVFGDPILRSEAVLIRPEDSELSDALNTLTRRLQGVLTAQQYVLMDYDVAEENLELAVQVTPGLESPTVSPLHNGDWFAVRAMVPKADTNRIMDRLYGIGARAILVTPIHACRI